MQDDERMIEKTNGENPIVKVLKAIVKINVVAFKALMRFVTTIFSFMSH